jgi:hypothetical protein
MKYIRCYNEESITDKSLEDWCKELKLYKFEIDGDIVNVNSDIFIKFTKMSKFPIRFGLVSGSFDCAYNELISLDGSPYKVGYNYYCNSNKLTSLKGCPKIINGTFGCYTNKLKTLKDGPEEVFNTFQCSNNKLKTLEGMPMVVGLGLYCTQNPIYEVYKLFEVSPQFTSLYGENYTRYKASLDYNYWRGFNIVKRRFEKACLDANIATPDSIPGYKYI